MALKKIRFVWPTPPLPEGRWRLGLFHYAQSIDPARPLPPGGVPAYWKGYLHHTLTFSLRGLLAWGAILAVAAYFLGAGLLHHRHERANPHNRVGYWDLALPHRWSERARLQGEGFILLARDKLAEGRFQEGFALLRLGVERAPRDAAARLDLARLFVALRLRPQAEKLLRDGLAHGYPGREYLDFAFTLASEGDQPEAWLSLCQLARQSLDSTPEAPASEHTWLDRQLVRALIADGRLGEAVAHLATRYPESDSFRREITLLDLLEKGDATTAAAVATRWAEEQPRSPEPLRLLVRALRESGDLAAMDAALARLRALDPAKPDALLYSITQNHAAGRPDAARSAHQAIIFRHGASPAIHATLAAIYAELGLRHEIIAMQEELRSRGLPAAGILIPLLQADILAQDWNAALSTLEKFSAPSAGSLSATQSAWLETMRRLVLACADAGSGNQSSLVEAIADRPGTLRLYLLAIRSLLAADRLETAAQVLALAEGPFPSARALTRLRSEIETARAAHAATLPAAPSAAPREGDPLADADAFFTAIERCIQTTDTPGAFALLAEARRARPAWLIGEEPRLDAFELPLQARGDDPLRLQLLARRALGRAPGAADTLLTLSRAIHAEGHPSNAVLLLKEILRHRPDHPETLSQLAKWEPAKPQRPLDIAP